MKLQDYKKLSASELSDAVNNETKALGSAKGVVKLVGKMLAALAVIKLADSGNKIKTLTKYADGKGVCVRDVPKQSWCYANVCAVLFGDGADKSGTVNETHLDKASVHTLNAASAALNTLAAKVAADKVSAVEAKGYREGIAAAVRASVEKDAKAQSEALHADEKSEKDEAAKLEAAKTPAQKLMEAHVTLAKMTAGTELQGEQIEALQKWHASYGAQLAERAGVAAAAKAAAKAAAEVESEETKPKAKAEKVAA